MLGFLQVLSHNVGTCSFDMSSKTDMFPISLSTHRNQGSHRLEKYLNLEGFLENKISCLEKYWKMLHQIKTQQFCTNFLILISPLSQSSISERVF